MNLKIIFLFFIIATFFMQGSDRQEERVYTNCALLELHVATAYTVVLEDSTVQGDIIFYTLRPGRVFLKGQSSVGRDVINGTIVPDVLNSSLSTCAQ